MTLTKEELPTDSKPSGFRIKFELEAPPATSANLLLCIEALVTSLISYWQAESLLKQREDSRVAIEAEWQRSKQVTPPVTFDYSSKWTTGVPPSTYSDTASGQQSTALYAPLAAQSQRNGQNE